MANDGIVHSNVLEFGAFRVLPSGRRLEREGREVKIGSRAFDVLVTLLERAGEVLSKEVLMARVWPDTTVHESGLRVHIAALRKALGDGQGAARYVTNVPGRGYCFVAPVVRSSAEVEHDTAGEASPTLHRLTFRFVAQATSS